MPIYDALFDHLEEINHVLTRHEQGAIHAAQGYARTSEKQALYSQLQNGATNLITGLADALIDSTPLVCITGQVAFTFGNGCFSRNRCDGEFQCL